jgi:hypothetical protein
MAEMNDFNAKVIEEFRANGGKVGGQFEGAPLLLLTTTGAKTGAPTNPDWFHNLVAHPEVTVEVGAERFTADASVVEGEERDRIYAAHAAANPGFAEYQEKTDRVIPVVALDRR